MSRIASLIEQSASSPWEAIEDAVGLAALCALIVAGFAVAAVV